MVFFLYLGLDIPKHNEPAYPVEAYGHGHIEKLIQILETQPMVVTQGNQLVFLAKSSQFCVTEYYSKNLNIFSC